MTAVWQSACRNDSTQRQHRHLSSSLQRNVHARTREPVGGLEAAITHVPTLPAPGRARARMWDFEPNCCHEKTTVRVAKRLGATPGLANDARCIFPLLAEQAAG